MPYMELSKRTLRNLAEMICGASGGGYGFERENFPYRSSKYLTEFFENCEIPRSHDGSTRKTWVKKVLTELNTNSPPEPSLPSRELLTVIRELMDRTNFDDDDSRDSALAELNRSLERDGLEAYIAQDGSCEVRSLNSGIASTNLDLPKRTWSKEEQQKRKLFSDFLNEASEDEFTEELLAPTFDLLGFKRISVTGHRDKSLEYGKDLWMKYQLPTHHTIYFGAQIKIGKLDAAAGTKNINISTVLNQITMMLEHPIWDPETNKKHLLDHVFIIAAGKITKQAKNFLGQKLDAESRRHIIFMDGDDVLDLAVRSKAPLPDGFALQSEPQESFEDLPF